MSLHLNTQMPPRIEGKCSTFSFLNLSLKLSQPPHVCVWLPQDQGISGLGGLTLLSVCGVVWYLRLSCHFSLYCKLDTGLVGQTAKLTPCYWRIDPENVIMQSASHHLRQKHNMQSHLLVGAHQIILCFISEKGFPKRYPVINISLF